MKKSDLVKAARKGFPNVTDMVNNMLRSISTALVNGEDVTIQNFGSFRVEKTTIRHVYDFKQKKVVPYDGHYKIKFRPAKAVEKILNKNKGEK
jgi:nucleoid DNA-binding protein